MNCVRKRHDIDFVCNGTGLGLRLCISAIQLYSPDVIKTIHGCQSDQLIGDSVARSKKEMNKRQVGINYAIRHALSLWWTLSLYLSLSLSLYVADGCCRQGTCNRDSSISLFFIYYCIIGWFRLSRQVCGWA